MSGTSEAPWKAGDKAVIGHRMVTIDKVTASGRAVVGDQTFNSDGSRRGGDTYSSPRLRLLTPEVEAEIAFAHRAGKARQAALDASRQADQWVGSRFGVFSRGGEAPLADIERAENLAAAIAKVLSDATDAPDAR